MKTIEFDLAVACCSRAFAWSQEKDVKPAPDIDWDRFLRLVRRHRVEALAFDALCSTGDLPAVVHEALAADAARIGRQNLMCLAASIRLRDAFRTAGIPLLFLKGLTVGALAYRDAMLKSGWDIDILVPDDRIADSARCLERLGFAPVMPRPGGVAHERWHRWLKESIWYRAEDDMTVELHGRLLDHGAMLNRLHAGSESRQVEVRPGIAFATFQTDDLFAYLCGHGASSSWFRLKWLADLAGLVGGMDDQRIAALFNHGAAHGAGRPTGSALILLADIFGLETPIVERLRSDPPMRSLAAAAKRILCEPSLNEPTDRRFATLPLHFNQLRLVPGIAYAASEIGRQLRHRLIHRL